MSIFNLMILASTPEDALSAQKAGVDRIFYNLEYIGKTERQRGRNTVKYYNDIDSIPAVREALTTSELLVRTNPITNPYRRLSNVLVLPGVTAASIETMGRLHSMLLDTLDSIKKGGQLNNIIVES